MAPLNPYAIVDEFEKTIAEWAGAKYGIAVESCSAALFLCLEYALPHYVDKTVKIPKMTYPSVPCAVIHAGGKVKFTDEKWSGIYELKPLNIFDGALRFQPGMYHGGLHCLSFHMKKHLPIGRGGMILTNNENEYHYFKKARFDGRDELPLQEDNLTQLGWNMYMSPTDAARGMMLFSTIRFRNLEDIPTEQQGYPDLSKYAIYTS